MPEFPFRSKPLQQLPNKTTPVNDDSLVGVNSSDGLGMLVTLTNLWDYIKGRIDAGATWGGQHTYTSSPRSSGTPDSGLSILNREQGDERWALSKYIITHGSGDPDDVPEGYNLYVDQDSGVLWKRDGASWVRSFTPSLAEVYFVTELPNDATGNNGDLAVIYTDGTISGLAEKTGGTWTQVADNVAAVSKPTDLGAVSLVDHFLGGTKTLTESTGVVGELNWTFLRLSGSTGAARGQSTTALDDTLGILNLVTGTSSGNAVAISMDRGVSSGNTFPLGALGRMNNFVMRWRFKANTSGDYHIGLSNNPASSVTEPTRFLGIRALESEDNFEFCNFNGTPSGTDTGVAIDNNWHIFELRYLGSNTWAFNLDGGEDVPLSGVSSAQTVTFAAWVKTNSSSDTLSLDTFQLYGEHAY